MCLCWMILPGPVCCWRRPASPTAGRATVRSDAARVLAAIERLRLAPAEGQRGRVIEVEAAPVADGSLARDVLRAVRRMRAAWVLDLKTGEVYEKG